MAHDLYFVCVLVLLPAGLEIGYALLPFFIALHGNKGFGPVWGTALYTMLRLLFLVPGFPLLSWLLHHAWPHVTTPDAVAQRVSPFLTHAANSPACLFLSAAVFACLCSVGLFALFLGVFLDLAVLSLLRLIR
jgi:hypothetical protein